MATNGTLSPRIQKSILRGNILHGLRSPGLLAKWPTVGMMMFLLASLIFGALAYGTATNPALVEWDHAVAEKFHATLQALPSPIVEYVVFGFFVGREIIVILGTILAIYFLYKRFWREFLMVLIGSGGGGLLWYALSRLFDRARPAIQTEIVLSDPSFPSGHALSALVFYGLLAYLLVPKMPSRFWKWFVVVLSAFVILFVGLSRLILGGHYVTDVVAGYAIGIAWAGLVYTLTEIFFREKGIQDHASDQHNTQGLQSPGVFQRWPIIGVILFLLGSLGFAALGYELIRNGPLIQLDLSIYRELIAQAQVAPPRIGELMLFGFFVGKQVILVMVTLLCIYFFHKRYWSEMAMLLLSSAGGSFVWNYFVNFFARPRPTQQTGLEVTSIPAFPSGHAMSAIICYGFLAYVLIPHMPSRSWKWVVGLAAIAVILFDGYSRIFQGSHYLSDVLAGYALGLAWAVLIYTLIERVFMKRKVSTNG